MKKSTVQSVNVQRRTPHVIVDETQTHISITALGDTVTIDKFSDSFEPLVDILERLDCRVEYRNYNAI